MSKESNTNQSHGLLSKVVKFVSNPTKDWKELDETGDSDFHDDEASAQQVRERIERKRRNDFVRKTEFAQLRKIIHSRRKAKAPATPVLPKAGAVTDLTVGPGALSSQHRTGTLQKIDEIEKQMSTQWWQGEGEKSAAEGAASARASTDAADSGFFMNDDSFFFADEVYKRLQAAKAIIASQEESAIEDPLALKLLCIERLASFLGLEEKFVHESDLEEAAILFASDRPVEAEKTLVDIIRQKPVSPEGMEAQKDLWMALFDLYRATGQQERFDIVSIDFAQLFGRSAPQWISLPELLGHAQGVGEAKRQFAWISSPELTPQSIVTAAALKSRATAPYHLNWTRLKKIEFDALPQLVGLITDLANSVGNVSFVGEDVLMGLVDSVTITGDNTVGRQWWMLRLALLRLMGRNEEFEMAALDYTVTYEESPPAWSAPVAKYVGAQMVQEGAADAGKKSDGEIELRQEALVGRIENDATEQLDQMVAGLAADAPINIDCSRLISIDFPAAGSVLNWAALQQSNGRLVAFTNLHRLVAVFFNIIGIQEHAKIIPRKD